jgi:hypothetical protein
VRRLLSFALLLAACSPDARAVQSEPALISVAGEPTGVQDGKDHIEARPYMDRATKLWFGKFNYPAPLLTPTLDAPATWLSGDRIGYTCLYDFAAYRDWLVARATYSSIGGPNHGGAKINEAYMEEGFRHYDGTFDGPGGVQQFDDECKRVPDGNGVTTAGPPPEWSPLPLETDFGSPPVIGIVHGPHAIDVRDFADLEDVTLPPHSSLRLRIAGVSERRITVVGYERTSSVWAPRLEIHFDLMAPGVVVPGTEHPVTLVVG